MHQKQVRNLGRLVLLGGFAVAWLLPSIISTSDLPPERILAMCAAGAYAGVMAWVFAPQHQQVQYGALAGVLLVVSWVIVWMVMAILAGTLISEGETVFSWLIELPVWVGVLAVLGGFLASVGWLVARAVATAGTRRHAH